MRLPHAPLLPLALCLGCIHAHHVPDGEHSHPPLTSELATLPSGITCTYPDLVAYAQAQEAIRDSAPIVTPDVEERLLIDAAKEVKHLGIYDDNQRARLSHILEATRAIIKQRSALPTTIHPDTDPNTLKQLADKFEITFLEYASLSSSRKWSKYCMAAFLGENTLVRLLPFLSQGFVNSHKYLMFQASAIVADFETLHAVAEHSRLPHARLHSDIIKDVLFSGKVEFVRRFADFIPEFIQDCSMLETAIKLNHRSLFKHLYDETIKQKDQQWTLNNGIARALEALAVRGWKHEFKQLHQDHPQLLNTKKCLISAAKHGHIEILKYLLFDDKKLAEEARPHINIAFELAVGFGNIKAINFLLGDEERKAITPDLFFIQPTPAMLKAVGESGRWDGIEHLMQLKQQGDARFEQFQLGGDATEAVKMAFKHGHLQVLKHLLQKNAQGQFLFTFEDPRKTFQESLVLACQHGHVQVVQELLRKDENGYYVHQGIDPAEWNNWALVLAGQNGHLLVVQELLRKDGDGNYVHQGTDLVEGGNWALKVACEKGHLPVVQELLRKDENGHYVHQGIDPAEWNNWALRHACQNGHLLVVQELLRKDETGNYVHQGIDPAAWDNEALVLAGQNGHVLVVQELLRKDERGNYVHQGINPAARNNAPLIEACGKGRLDIVKILLQGRPNARGVIEYEHDGIDAAAQDNMALLKAMEAQQTEIVQFLLQKTEEGEYIFPGILVTDQMRLLVASMHNPRLTKLL